jgi:hypothetical protein
MIICDRIVLRSFFRIEVLAPIGSIGGFVPIDACGWNEIILLAAVSSY